MEWADAMEQLAERFPMIFVTSRIQKTRLHQFIWQGAEETDGLIESRSAFWPSEQVHWAMLDGWHHVDTVGFTYDRWLLGDKQKNRKFFLSTTLSALYNLLATKQTKSYF